MTQIGSIHDTTLDAEMLKEKAAAAKDAVADLGCETKRYASNRLEDKKDTAAGWMETAKDKAGEMNDAVVEYVQKNPFTAMGIAVGIGFVAGLILKRR